TYRWSYCSPFADQDLNRLHRAMEVLRVASIARRGIKRRRSDAVSLGCGRRWRSAAWLLCARASLALALALAADLFVLAAVWAELRLDRRQDAPVLLAQLRFRRFQVVLFLIEVIQVLVVGIQSRNEPVDRCFKIVGRQIRAEIWFGCDRFQPVESLPGCFENR